MFSFSESTFSDDAIRRFLLAQLPPRRHSHFEATLIGSSVLEQRVRLAELELLDDCARNRLNAKERKAFQIKFLITDARRQKLGVAIALHESLHASDASESSSAMLVFTWPRLAWRIAFAILVVAVLIAGALVVRKEPQVVKRFIPKPLRPRTVAPRTPQAAHHPMNSSEPAAHGDKSTPLPGHEASPPTILLRKDVTAHGAPTFDLNTEKSRTLRLELLLDRNESATFSVRVTTSAGEVVYEVSDIGVAGSDRISLDVPVDRLKPGNFQVAVTRVDDPSAATLAYYFRVQ